MYGAVCVMLRNVGVLNLPRSPLFFVTSKRPASCVVLSMPTPMSWYVSSVKLNPVWQALQLAARPARRPCPSPSPSRPERSAPDLRPTDDFDRRLEPPVVAIGQRRLRLVPELQRDTDRQGDPRRVVVDTPRALLARVQLVGPQPGVMEEQPDVAQQLLRMIHEH